MRRAAHGLVLIWVLWSTTSLDNDPRLLVSGWLFGVKSFPPDSRPVDGYAGEPECRTALERHMTFLKAANDSYQPGVWKREADSSVSQNFPTGMIVVRNRLECRQQ